MTGMDLEKFRKDKGLTYEQLANQLGVSQSITARYYSLGIRWPHPLKLERIKEISNNLVTIEAMHERRLEYVKSLEK